MADGVRRAGARDAARNAPTISQLDPRAPWERTDDPARAATERAPDEPRQR